MIQESICIGEVDELHVTLKSTLRDLNSCESYNMQLSGEHIQRKEFIEQLEVARKILERAKILAIQASSTLINDSDRFSLNSEFSLLILMIGKNFSNTL